jgi:hypothetical protein
LLALKTQPANQPRSADKPNVDQANIKIVKIQHYSNTNQQKSSNKHAITNNKQAMVQKPKPSMEGVCLLKPKPAEKALLKTLPPAEEVVDREGPSTIVDDSDDEQEEYVAPSPVAPVVQQEPEVVVEETPVVAEEPLVAAAATEEKPKKKPVLKSKKTA